MAQNLHLIKKKTFWISHTNNSINGSSTHWFSHFYGYEKWFTDRENKQFDGLRLALLAVVRQCFVSEIKPTFVPHFYTIESQVKNV